MIAGKIFAALTLLILSTSAALVPGANFDRVVIIVLENQDYAEASRDPYLSSLSSNGALLTNYMAIAHPSQPNYLAIVAGTDEGISDDGNYNFGSKTVVDLLEAKGMLRVPKMFLFSFTLVQIYQRVLRTISGISWKSYQENYPSTCYTGTSSRLYYRKHNPFISFTNISGNSTRCAKIVDATELATDIQNNAVPQFVWYTPNINDDGHNTNLATASKWLKGFLTPKLSEPNFITNTVVLITFDESETQSGPNQVYSALVGPVVSVQGSDNTAYTHYSMLATIEENWGLGNLGQNDVDAIVFNNLAKPDVSTTSTIGFATTTTSSFVTTSTDGGVATTTTGLATTTTEPVTTTTGLVTTTTGIFTTTSAPFARRRGLEMRRRIGWRRL
ncbi:phosphoesterase family-domain-containing protein [Endogone sp. FLAS-F59071]|nr:phosphoesterase family-domain-containing protein [Endogone sp. FLAS-F59071]|eukprot:RUS23449.1 phosphoesterase family-domain-containing protein [Endogone sp. FLAS-F59071]